jgi:hypothetical protein
MPKQGYISASQFPQLMVKGDIAKDQFGTGALTMAYELACERLGVELPDAFGAALDWGNEHEWSARELYTERTMREVVLPSFIQHATLEKVGGTPDGLVGEDGIIEIKCPYTPVNHLKNLLTASQYESDYKAQIQGYLWITGRKWCDFISYDPRFPEAKQIAIHRKERDEDYIAILAARVERFEKEIQKVLNAL